MSANPSTYPHVLVVNGYPISKTTATGITLAHLFADWPRNSLAQIYLSGTPDELACRLNWSLRPSSFPVDYWARRCLRRLSRNHAFLPDAGSPLNGDCSESTAHMVLRAINDMGPMWDTSEIRRNVQEFRPDIIYTTLGSLRMFDVALATSTWGRCPVVPHFMDDWTKTLYAGSLLVAPVRSVLDRRVRQMVNQAPLGMAISPQMASEYERRYRLSFLPFNTCVDDEVFNSARDPRPSIGPLRFVYAGGLHLERWLPLSKIAAALSEAGHELLVLAPPLEVDRYRPYFPARNVAFRSVPFDDVKTELQSADVLVHVESFRCDLAEYTKYSISTKLPQYMAARRPILAVGPGGLASMQLVVDAQAGVHVPTYDTGHLTRAIAEYGRAPQLRSTQAENGFRYAREHFLASSVRRRFRQALASCVAQRGAGERETIQ